MYNIVWKQAIIIMEEYIHYGKCGVPCNSCPFYHKNKTFHKNVEEALKIIENKAEYEIVEMLKLLKSVVCFGCETSIISPECKVRDCTISRNHNTCWSCILFPCKKLKHVWENQEDMLDKMVELVKQNKPNEFYLIFEKYIKNKLRLSANPFENILNIIWYTHMDKWMKKPIIKWDKLISELSILSKEYERGLL